MEKIALIGVFVKKNKILAFLEMLKYKYSIGVNRVFIYEIENNSLEYLVTFKATNKELYLKVLRNATVLHVKNGCLFSINALNKLIEIENGQASSEYIVDWNLYRNKLLILTNGKLFIEKINKIDDKCSIFF